jgi:hypothetical protein
MTAAATHINPAHFRNLLTKKQVAWVYSFAGMTEDLIPGKCKVTRLEVPSQRLLITIQPTEHRDDTKKHRLYLCEHSYYR